jgi:hypothetical protein
MTKLKSAMHKAGLIGLVALVASPMSSYADPSGTRVRRGYVLTGTVSWSYNTNQNDCKRSCDVDPQCRAWNYAATGNYRGHCERLSSPGGLDFRDGWVSGIKPPPPAVKAGREQPPPPPVVKR